jgi:EmrB/QacA subfamily drug resistance transporter
MNQSFFKKWGALIVLSLALAIIVIDTTLLNVSLSAIIRDLNTDIQHFQWVISAYSLMLAAFTITGGRLGDIFGRKRMFVLGAIIFAIGSFIASISSSVGILIIGESIIEGIGAALMMPATASILVTTFKGRDRAIAFGVWGGIAAAAAAIGPLLGGYLTTYYSWRWGFRINLVVAAVLVIFSYLIKDSRDTEEKPEIDYLGVVLSALGLFGITFAIIEASRYGWWYAKETFMIGSFALNLFGNLSITVFSFVWGLIFLMLFFLWEVTIEKRGHTPLVSIKLFQNKRYSSGLTTTAVMSLGQTGMFFALPVFFQAVGGLDAFHTGLGLLPLSLSVLIGAPLSAYVVKWLYPKTLVILGLAISVMAYIVLILSLSVTATPLTLTPGLILFGLGMGLVMAQITNITLSAVSPQESGEASGVNNTMRQVGSTLGSAIIGSILVTMIASGLRSGVESSTVIPLELKATISENLASQSSNVEFGSEHFSSQIPENIKQEITSISHESTVRGNKYAQLFSLGSTLLALIAASRLPKERNVEREASVASGH